MDQNDFDDETPAVRFIKRLIVRKKRVAKETMKSKKEVMFKKANDVLKKCKSCPSKEDAEDAFGKQLIHQLRSFHRGSNISFILKYRS